MLGSAFSAAPRRRRLMRGAVVAASLAAVLSGAGVAVAAGGGPTLVKPANKGSVPANNFKLVVKDTSSLASQYGVFAGISRSKKTKKGGILKEVNNVKKGESFVKLKKWSGHPGYSIYTPPKYTFSGYWADTPGRYYWQAEHTDCEISSCEAVSAIGSFKVS
jgi:hypothetical protein